MSQRARAGLAAVALGMQFVVLYAPRAPAVDTGGIPVDKLVHVAAFALPTAALIAAGLPRGWVIGLMAAHAPLSELLQGQLLADRSAEGADVVADLVGVALGALVIRRATRPEAAHPDEKAWADGPPPRSADRSGRAESRLGPAVRSHRRIRR
jgi:VanZ family protein